LNAQTDIPRLVRELRERTGLTKEKFVAKLGVTFPTINRWADCPQLGYEILPNKYFYRYQPPTPGDELLAEFWRLEKEAEKLLEGLAR
jgi:hypothetical protein